MLSLTIDQYWLQGRRELFHASQDHHIPVEGRRPRRDDLVPHLAEALEIRSDQIMISERIPGMIDHDQ